METSSVDPGEKKTKSQLKAERRAKQEAERAAKAQKQQDGGSATKSGDQKSTKKPPKLTPEELAKAKQEKLERQRLKKEQQQIDTTKQTNDATCAPGKAPQGTPPPVTTSSPNCEPPATAPHSSSDQAGQPPRVTTDVRMDDPAQQKKLAKSLGRHKIPQRPAESKRVALFQHLPQYDKRVDVIRGMKLGITAAIHPAFLELGLKMDEGLLSGSNSRCLAFLSAMQVLVRECKSPSTSDFVRHFNQVLQRHVAFIDQCRPLAVTMRTAISYLKQSLNSIDKSLSESEIRNEVLNSIDDFVENRIIMADKAIANFAVDRIKSGDLILVFSYSSLVMRVLQHAWQEKRISFTVLVVDSRPRLEGRTMLSALLRLGIPCRYILISGVASVMRHVSLVILGAHSLLSNGYVMSRVGSGYIANVASAFNIPLFVCCETYKFWERSQTDAFEYNELWDPDDLVKKTTPSSSSDTNKLLADWRNTTSNLCLLNIANDVISHELVQVVVTELGIIPTRSVPVVMRVKHVGVC